MMAPTTEDLRATLRVMADEHPPPAPADLLDALRAERRARRARAGWIAAAGVAAATVAAVAVTQAWPEPGATGPAGESGVVSTSWELVDGAPPEYADGLHLLETVDLASSAEVSLTSPASDTQRYAVLWCETGPDIDDPAIQPPVLALDDVDARAACLPAEGTPDGAEVAPAPLPPTDEVWAASWEGDLPEGAEVDGTLITDDGDDPQAWQAADPALRDGAFSAFTAGQRLSIPVPAELTARGEPVLSTLAPRTASPGRSGSPAPMAPSLQKPPSLRSTPARCPTGWTSGSAVCSGWPPGSCRPTAPSPSWSCPRRCTARR